jgi:catechol 2,3-dioxygenase-like lactoylglutathione lyase family enzyme
MPRLDAIGIVTADMAASCRFYRLLGVDVADPAPDADHHEATLPSGIRLMWDTVELMRQIDTDWQPPVGQRMALAFLCNSPAAVDETHAAVLAAGFEGKREPWDAFWGQRYAQVIDPDGNEVHLFAPLSA